MGNCLVCLGEMPRYAHGITCSDGCHEILVDIITGKCGEFKKVIDIETNIEYKVPVRDIIENGLKYEDLPKYPIWNEE